MKPRRKQVRCEINLYPLYEEKDVKCTVYDKVHMSALRIKNTSGSDPRSYEVTQAALLKLLLDFITARITFICNLVVVESHAYEKVVFLVT